MIIKNINQFHSIITVINLFFQLHSVVLIFLKNFFQINKLNLLKPLIRAIDNCGHLYEFFSMSDKITYKYYLGRKAMFDSDLKLCNYYNYRLWCIFLLFYIVSIFFLDFQIFWDFMDFKFIKSAILFCSWTFTIICIQKLSSWMSSKQASYSHVFNTRENVSWSYAYYSAFNSISVGAVLDCCWKCEVIFFQLIKRKEKIERKFCYFCFFWIFEVFWGYILKSQFTVYIFIFYIFILLFLSACI